MFCRLDLFFITTSLLLFGATANSSPQQYSFQSSQSLSQEEGTAGYLWRLNVSHVPEKDLKSVLSLAKEHELDIWKFTHDHLDVFSPVLPQELPASFEKFSPSLITNITSPHRLHVTNLSEWNLTSLMKTTYHSDYHPLYEVEWFFHELQSLHPDVMTIEDLGHSGLGREMYGLRISKDTSSAKKKAKKKKPHSRDEEKLAFVLVGAQHAREWVASSTALYLVHALVTNRTEPQSLSHLLKTYDFYIVPIPNPDGYDYTWETDRFWYKTRQRMGPKGRCFGLDMNRNWGYKWRSGASKTFTGSISTDDPCSHWYPGHRPFESPEVNNIANWVLTIPNIVGFVDLRSYGQMLSTPFSYSCKTTPKDAEDQIEAALGAVRAMKGEHGMIYTTGQLCKMLYSAPGNIVDWMYKRMRIKYSYALHLRDTGTHGFVLPAMWIRPVGEETGAMLSYLAKFIAEKMGRKL